MAPSTPGSEPPPPRPPPGFLESAADEEEYAAGVAAFNRGDHYSAHDHFEALWGEDFWKGLIHAAVALHHHRARNPAGVAGLPENVPRLLGPYRPAYAGIDVDAFLADFTAFFERVERGDDPGIANAPRLRAASPTTRPKQP